MRTFLQTVCLLLILNLALGSPTPANQLDKATVNDVAANAVSPDKRNEDGATVQITGITTGVENPEQTPAVPFNPQKAGSMFARFIDDIFQIPINILQNVAQLITSPFIQTKKVGEATAPASPSA